MQHPNNPGGRRCPTRKRPVGRAGRAIGLGIGLLLVGCAPGRPTSTPAPTVPVVVSAPLPTPVATNAVDIENFAFSAAAIVVPVGTTVTWTNRDVEQHTVTARDHSFDSDALNQGKTFSRTFVRSGTYRYFCAIHPSMVGEVVVTGG